MVRWVTAKWLPCWTVASSLFYDPSRQRIHLRDRNLNRAQKPVAGWMLRSSDFIPTGDQYNSRGQAQRSGVPPPVVFIKRGSTLKGSHLTNTNTTHLHHQEKY